MTVLFRARDEATTELTLRHEQFPNAEERDGHAAGWQGTLKLLAATVE